MVQGFDRIAEPHIGHLRGVVAEDQQIRVAGGFSGLLHLRRPAKRFGQPAARGPASHRHHATGNVSILWMERDGCEGQRVTSISTAAL
jgi:hypothetical protein